MKKEIAVDSPEEMEYPTLLEGVTAKELPEVKNWEVGETYTLQITAELTEVRKSAYEKDAEVKACFKVKEIKNLGNTSKIEKLNEKLS